MKSLLLTGTALFMIFTPAQAQQSAQLNMNAVQTAKDPLTGLPPDQWVQLAVNLVNGKSILGKPHVFMINATGKEINTVMCDGKWQLVGNKPYLKDDDAPPSSLPSWKVTMVPTKGFDGYCKKSITAQTDDGSTYEGRLISLDGTFTNASFITFASPGH